MPEKLFRVLSLDGGGAKGFYTLGILREIEGLIECSIHERFDLIFGTSTGAIIAAMLALGKSVKEINETYTKNVTKVMQAKSASDKSHALTALSEKVFGDAKFETVKTGIGIVATCGMGSDTILSTLKCDIVSASPFFFSTCLPTAPVKNEVITGENLCRRLPTARSN